jgi:Tol biopolymer transport system component
LGPYEIVSPLGAGGMGEVYRARDTRLGRTVAIKVIAGEWSEDPKRRLRFQQEAETISNLNHPNICALYDVGEIPAGDSAQKRTTQYIVMEYLEGQTLEELLKKGPLPVDQVFRYGLEIADALDKAHRKQILHRDLKPSNIMITRTGARLFDFGLAKFLPEDAKAAVESRSITAAKPLTAEGSVIGTLEYVAPEQLRGKEADARTDIFSFGVCLYQMITGRRPFLGDTNASLVAAILERDPSPLSEYRPSIPPSFEWLVKNCLAKDPDERLQTAHDVKLELERIEDESRSPAPAASAPKAVRWFYWSVVTIAVLIAAAAVVIPQMKRAKPARAPVRRLSILLPATAPLAEGPFEKFAVTPDGNRIVYVGGSEPARLYVYSLDSLETKPLADTEGARGPFFSPDGEWVGFYTEDQGLKKTALAGGRPVLLMPERNLRGAAWGNGDVIVFAGKNSPLGQISASGGQSERRMPREPLANGRWPSFLPGGEHLLYTMSDAGGDYENGRVAIRSLKTGETKIVLDGATYGRYASGHLFYLHSQTLYAIPFDARALKVTGSPITVTSDIDSYFSLGLAHYAVSSDGQVFYIPREFSQSERELLWVDRSGKSTPVTKIHRAYQQPKLSPDGKRLLVTVGQAPQLDLWLFDIAREAWTRVTTEAENESGIWSPDGKQIAFASTRSGGFDPYVIPTDGGAPPKRITAQRSWAFPSSWSPDGKAIAVIEYTAKFNDIFVVAPREGAVPTPFLSTPFDERDPVFSPDGHWIAYRSNESGRDEIYVQRYPSTGRKWLVSTSGGINPVWRKDGMELFYRNGDKMMVVSAHLGSEFTATKPQMLFSGGFEDEYDVAPDGSRFIMVQRPPQAPRTLINVVLGLFGNRSE